MTGGVGRWNGNMIGRLGGSLLDLLFPRHCVVCGGSQTGEHTQLCRECAARIEQEGSAPVCPACGGAARPFEVSGGRCAACRQRPPRVLGTARAGPYRSLLGNLLLAYKYRGREELRRVLAERLASATRCAPWIGRIEAVVPVPTHWRHRLTRSVYPAEVLSSAVARATSLPLVPLLRRTRAGRHQVGLAYTKRLENVRGAFAFRKGYALSGARLLIVDDVRTTGATIDECARVLRRAGADEVYAAVVVKADLAPTGTRPAVAI